MHEMGIARSMYELVLKEAEESGARRVNRIDLVIGEMTGFVGEMVQHYFEFLSRGGIVEGAEVVIEMVPATAKCQNCQKTSKLERKAHWVCPHCGDDRMEIATGRELVVKSIGVETDGDKGP